MDGTFLVLFTGVYVFMGLLLFSMFITDDEGASTLARIRHKSGPDRAVSVLGLLALFGFGWFFLFAWALIANFLEDRR